MVELRSFRKEDAGDLKKNADNPRVAQFLPDLFPSPYPVEAAEWWVTEGHQLGNVLNQAIIVNGECAGSIGVTFLEGEYRYTAKLGYWLGEPYWGKGIMTQAVREFVLGVFEEFSTKRLYAPVVEHNTGSINVLRKAGFVCEGVYKHNVYLRGSFHDEHIYARYS